MAYGPMGSLAQGYGFFLFCIPCCLFVVSLIMPSFVVPFLVRFPFLLSSVRSFFLFLSDSLLLRSLPSLLSLSFSFLLCSLLSFWFVSISSCLLILFSVGVFPPCAHPYFFLRAILPLFLPPCCSLLVSFFLYCFLVLFRCSSVVVHFLHSPFVPLMLFALLSHALATLLSSSHSRIITCICRDPRRLMVPHSFMHRPDGVA